MHFVSNILMNGPCIKSLSRCYSLAEHQQKMQFRDTILNGRATVNNDGRMKI